MQRRSGSIVRAYLRLDLAIWEFLTQAVEDADSAGGRNSGSSRSPPAMRENWEVVMLRIGRS